MEDRRVEAFLAVVDEGGFTPAARVLFETQPAVTQQIASLERTLGVRLFTHERGRCALTEAGRVAERGFRQMKLAEERLREELAPFAERPCRLALGCAPDMMLYDAGTLGLVTAYVSRLLGVPCDAVPLEPDCSLASTFEQGMHLVFTTADRHSSCGCGDQVRFAPLFLDGLHVLCSRADPLGAGRAVGIDDLRGRVVYLFDGSRHAYGNFPQLLGAMRDGTVLRCVDSLARAVPDIASGDAVGVTSVVEKSLPAALGSAPLADAALQPVGIAWAQPWLDAGMRRLVPALRKIFAASPNLARVEEQA